MNIVIEFKHVGKSYNGKEIISDFNFSVLKGSFLTMIGSSGSGKTTLLKMINGLVKPDSGQVLVNGQDISSMDLIQLRRNIGYAIQGNVLFPHLTVEENIAYVLQLTPRPDEEVRKIVREKLEMFSLPEEILSRYPSELSGGQQQRVGLARACAKGSDILLMDEPFGAVDAITRYQLQSELKTLHEKTGMTIVFITHDIAEALKLGTQVLVLNEGKIQQIGPPKEIAEQPSNRFVERLVRMAD